MAAPQCCAQSRLGNDRGRLRRRLPSTLGDHVHVQVQVNDHDDDYYYDDDYVNRKRRTLVPRVGHIRRARTVGGQAELLPRRAEPTEI